MTGGFLKCANCGCSFQRSYALSAERAGKPQYCCRRCYSEARSVLPSPAEGSRYGRWTVLGRGPTATGRRKTWDCRCDCGTVRAVADGHLRRGASTNCGCARSDTSPRRTHGMSNSSEYRSWCLMKARCENPRLPEFRHYGARGITVCEEWRSDFTRFLSDMGLKPAAGMSIDRIDVNGNYEPSNCRWATPEVQANNTRRNLMVSVRGDEMTLAEAVRLHGGNYHTVKWRIRSMGMSAEEALGL